MGILIMLPRRHRNVILKLIFLTLSLYILMSLTKIDNTQIADDLKEEDSTEISSINENIGGNEGVRRKADKDIVLDLPIINQGDVVKDENLNEMKVKADVEEDQKKIDKNSIEEEKNEKKNDDKDNNQKENQKKPGGRQFDEIIKDSEEGKDNNEGDAETFRKKKAGVADELNERKDEGNIEKE